MVRRGFLVNACAWWIVAGLVSVEDAIAPVWLARQWPGAPMEIQSRVYLRLPRQRVWWVLQLPCVADRRGDGHIRGRCSKCPRVDGLDWQMRSCSCRQFIRTGSCEDVSHTQNAQAVLIVSDPWSRQRLNTVSGMLRNTLRS